VGEPIAPPPVQSCPLRKASGAQNQKASPAKIRHGQRPDSFDQGVEILATQLHSLAGVLYEPFPKKIFSFQPFHKAEYGFLDTGWQK